MTSPHPGIRKSMGEPASVLQRMMAAQETFQEKARRYVYEYIMARVDKSDAPFTFPLDGVYVVWFCKTLQNWKCLISTTLPDGMYYEVTHDGTLQQTYIDAYKKFDNVCILEGEDPIA